MVERYIKCYHGLKDYMCSYLSKDAACGIYYVLIAVICMYHVCTKAYVTGFWKTGQIVTLGLFHFIGPANGYTCTLHMHSAITRLG